MTKPTKLLLGFAVAGLSLGLALNAGLINTSNLEVLYAVLPLGAVFLGLFLIAKVLEKETQGYDEEHRTKTRTVSQSGNR